MLKKRFLLLICCCCCLGAAFSQSYWQQQVNYRIDVSLSDAGHTLDGFEKINYTNHSPDTLRFIWFHCWPNAYRNDKTAFSEQLLLNDRTDFYFSDRDQRGYINRLDFKVNGVTATMEDHPQYIDIIRVLLPQPLAPGQSITITTPFHVQLPQNFSRGGHIGESYQITQWYPKPAVYDRKGWHPIPYLDQGEFYSEFGDYSVSITIPKNYVVAATGELQNEEEKQWLRTRAGFIWEPVVHKQSVKRGSTRYVKKTVQLYPASDKEAKTLYYEQKNVHDFAWFADKRFVVAHDTLGLPSGKTVEVFSYYLPGSGKVWKESTDFIKKAVRYRSALIGEYPYKTVSAVEAPLSAGGGMEYPTITNIVSVSSPAELESIIEHEVGHNWLYGILATNERVYPWMDEGMNTYYDNRYKTWEEQPAAKSKEGFFRDHLPSDDDVLLATMVALKKDQPVNTPSEAFTSANYGLIPYGKAGDWMKLLEQWLGQPLFDSCMQAYFREWGFKHPYPEDFKKIVADRSGKPVDSIFALLDKTGSLGPPVKKQLKPAVFFNLSNTDKYSYINIMPALGYNKYDKLMLGALVHNYSLPPAKLHFLAAPLYATGSSAFNYLARVGYSLYPGGSRRFATEIGISAAKFSSDAYQPAGKDKITLGFRKYVPFIRVNFNSTNPLAKTSRWLQFKTYFISEDDLDFRTVINGPDTTNLVQKITGSRYINQLKFVVENKRALYPYRGEWQVEQADGFVRAAFTGNYYFNYSDRKGGLDLRLFAGKFFYTGAKTFLQQFKTDRYHLNLSGANGYEDYTYSNYFAGRNQFEGFASQQIMARDGFFKVRTDLLSSKVGKTDNWLSAINLTSDIPSKINPLSLLPVKIPLKVFADIGTYAEAWQANATTTRFLYDAGLQLSLLQETVNIYFPLLYSSVYSDYYKSTLGKNHFWKTVSFSIDIQRFSLRKISRALDF